MGYETETDRKNQRRIIAEWAPRHHFTPLAVAQSDTRPKPRIDHVLCNGSREVAGFAEVKTCSWPFGSFDFYLLQVGKCSAADEVGRAFQLPVYLVVEFENDCLAWLDITTVQRDRGPHKLPRRDRGTVSDCHGFLWSDFKIDRANSGLFVAHAPTEDDPRPPADRSGDVAEF